jgi:hypothetical protein
VELSAGTLKRAHFVLVELVECLWTKFKSVSWLWLCLNVFSVALFMQVNLVLIFACLPKFNYEPYVILWGDVR